MASSGLVAETQDSAAATIGVSTRQLARWINQGCPGEPRAYVISDIVAWCKENPWKVTTAADRGREIDIEMKSLALEEKRKTLLSREAVEVGLRSFTNTLRESFEKLEREFGAEALDIVLEPLEELESFDLSAATE